MIISLRDDGFANRILSLINCIVLSKHYETNFQFIWTSMPNEFMDIKTAEFFFTKAFLNKHFISVKEAEITKGITFDHEAIKFLNKETNQKKPNSINIYGHGNKVYSALIQLGKKEEDFRTAFKAIDFRNEILEAFEMGFKERLPRNSVGIHIRGGDIIYDQFVREEHYESKALPVSFAIEIIKSSKIAGNLPIVFSQDKFAVNKVQDLKKAALPSDFYYYNDRAKNLIYEIALMSKCTSIIGLDSSVLKLAILISTTLKKISSPFYGMNRQLLKQNLLRFIENENEIDQQIYCLKFLMKYFYSNKKVLKEIIDLLEIHKELVKRSGCLFVHYFILLCLTKSSVASESFLSESITKNNELEKNKMLEKMLIYLKMDREWRLKRRLGFNYISIFVKDFDMQVLKKTPLSYITAYFLLQKFNKKDIIMEFDLKHLYSLNDKTNIRYFEFLEKNL